MVTRFFRKLAFYFKPPKKGDVFLGDPLWFVVGRPIEYILHGLKDREGNTVWEPVPSMGCFKLKFDINVGNLYYVLGSEVLCRKDVDNAYVWMKRSQPRRMAKEMFRELYLNGMVWRE